MKKRFKLNCDYKKYRREIGVLFQLHPIPDIALRFTIALFWINIEMILKLSKVTPKNLLRKLGKGHIGSWSTYGLASTALSYYFPKEYENEDISTFEESKLLESMGFETWEGVIEKYHNEVGYKESDLVGTNPY